MGFLKKAGNLQSCNGSTNIRIILLADCYYLRKRLNSASENQKSVVAERNIDRNNKKTCLNVRNVPKPFMFACDMGQLDVGFGYNYKGICIRVREPATFVICMCLNFYFPSEIWGRTAVGADYGGLLHGPLHEVNVIVGGRDGSAIEHPHKQDQSHINHN